MTEQNKPDEWRKAGKELAKMADDVTDPKPDEPMQKAEQVYNLIRHTFQGEAGQSIAHIAKVITQAKEEERRRCEEAVERSLFHGFGDKIASDIALSAIRNEE